MQAFHTFVQGPYTGFSVCEWGMLFILPPLTRLQVKDVEERESLSQ